MPLLDSVGHRRGWCWRKGAIPAGAVLVCALIGGSLVMGRHVMGDSAELAGAIAEPGIAHPPGYAAYTMLGHAWGVLLRLLSGGHLPWLVATNLFSLLWALVAVACWLACWRHLAGAAARRSLLAQGVAVGVLLLWFGHPMMLLRGATTEVYSIHLGLIGLIWWLTLRLWHGRRRHGLPSAGLILAISLVGALGCLHHATFVLAAPAVLLAVGWVLSHRGRLGLRAWTRGLLLVVAGLLLGISTLAYLWVRSRQMPQINWGTPGADWISFWQHITAAQYDFYLHGGSPSGLGGSLWRRLPGVDRILLLPALPVMLGGLIIALHGWRQRLGATRRRLVGCLALHALLGLGFNRLYAIHDINEYFLPIWWLAALLGAVGLSRWILTVPSCLWRLIAPLLAAAAIAWVFMNYRATAQQEARMAYRAERIVERWRALPVGEGTVMISTDAVGLLNYEQVVKQVHPELLICELHDFRRTRYFRDASVRLRVAPVLFYEDGKLDVASLRFSENLVPLVKRNFWARVPGRLIDFDPALGLGGEARLRPQQVTQDFAIEVVRYGLAEPGDILPIHKTLEQFRAKTGHWPAGYDPGLWNDAPGGP